MGTLLLLLKKLTENETNKNVINAITIEEILNQYSIKQVDLLKLDIEGSEKAVFEMNYEDWLSKCNAIIVEIHDHLQPESEKTVLDALQNSFLKKRVGEYHYFSRK